VESRLGSVNEVVLQDKLDARDEADVRALVERITTVLHAKFAVRILALPPQHFGFGSKTALLLAIGAACNALLGSPLTPDDIKQLSRRGGTSGVGVNIFFLGGLIVELGHPESTGLSFMPSSASQPSGTPPVGVRVPFPQQWQVHLFLPNGRIYAGSDEITFFRQNTPIPGEEAFRVLAAVYHGIVPAFIDGDLRLLKQSMGDVHATGFKQRELQGQSEELRGLLEFLNKHDHVAAGMSSLGPLIYAIAPADASVKMEKIVMAVQETSHAVYLGACKGRNAGHETNENL
jgi:beta-ribofuranosylaminobenzene 5'-phosphate synthase